MHHSAGGKTWLKERGRRVLCGAGRIWSNETAAGDEGRQEAETAGIGLSAGSMRLAGQYNNLVIRHIRRACREVFQRILRVKLARDEELLIETPLSGPV